MSDESLIAKPPALQGSAFLDAEKNIDQHIVDTLIEERCPKLRDSWSWPLVRPVLYKTLGYRRAREMADTIMQLTGRESFDHLSRQLDFSLDVEGIDRLPQSGRVIIAANHPTGLADGVAVWDSLKQVREDVVFFANADAIRVNPQFQDVIIPVEWVAEKRTPAKTRETLKRAGQAFAEEKCVVIFPSGRLARKEDGRLIEKDWFSTVVGLARKQEAPILPLNLDAWNSRLFYFFSELNPELRDITLFHELLNKRGAEVRMTFGQMIPPDRLQGDAGDLTEKLKHHVAYDLLQDSAAVFKP
ncbi:GNAT family N-acetyltransferase [Hyphomonas sp.]|uniref:GNAT family N-acetyltransferase n=1 Tax=Hyphomonas sp. TaxID=87 RepID=UPI0030031EFD